MKHPALLILLAALLLLAGCESEDEVEWMAAVPDTAPVERLPAPDFSLQTVDGDSFTLSEQQGQVVLINFWATWCLPCVVEVPELIRVQEEFREEGLLVVGVSHDSGPSAHVDVRDFAEMFEVNYPLMIDADLRVGGAYGGNLALPTTFLVDREGHLGPRRTGLLTREDLLQLLEEEL